VETVFLAFSLTLIILKTFQLNVIDINDISDIFMQVHKWFYDTSLPKKTGNLNVSYKYNYYLHSNTQGSGDGT
jgi:hypothetical protein